MKAYVLKTTEEFGRGLYATRDISEGDIITECEVLVLSPDDTVKVNQTDLKYYTFVYDNSRDCLVLGDGEIFNHADQPNVSYELVEFENRKIMVFTAIADIPKGNQLFTDYNQDMKVDTNNYLNQKSLI